MCPLSQAQTELLARTTPTIWDMLIAFFIAFATLVFVKLMRLPQHVEADARMQRHTRLAIATGVIAMLVPSTILTYRLVRDQQFISATNQLLSEMEQRPGAILLAREITPKGRKITLT